MPSYTTFDHSFGKCYTTFSGSDLKGTAAAVAGASPGGYVGAGTGIVPGPFGGIAGTIPGAAITGLLGFLGCVKIFKYPACGKLFWL